MKNIGLLIFLLFLYSLSRSATTSINIVIEKLFYILSKEYNCNPSAVILTKDTILYESSIKSLDFDSLYFSYDFFNTILSYQIIQLQKKKKLSPSESVSKYIPNLSKKFKSIIIESLISKTANFINPGYGGFASNTVVFPSDSSLSNEFLKDGYFVDNKSDKIESIDYQTFILAKVVEILVSMKIEDYITTKVINPQKLQNTKFKIGNPHYHKDTNTIQSDKFMNKEGLCGYSNKISKDSCVSLETSWGDIIKYYQNILRNNSTEECRKLFNYENYIYPFLERTIDSIISLNDKFFTSELILFNNNVYIPSQNKIIILIGKGEPPDDYRLRKKFYSINPAMIAIGVALSSFQSVNSYTNYNEYLGNYVPAFESNSTKHAESNQLGITILKDSITTHLLLKKNSQKELLVPIGQSDVFLGNSKFIQFKRNLNGNIFSIKVMFFNDKESTVASFLKAH